MNQADLQTLTRERLLDAEALILQGRWSFAYYAAGYAVECALKSCLLSRMVYTGWIFEEKAKIAECFIHDFEGLVRLAGMRDLLDEKRAESAAGNRAFLKNWDTVRLWKVTDRYDFRTEDEAVALYDAITDQSDGVLTWITKFW